MSTPDKKDKNKPEDSLLYGSTSNETIPGHTYDGIREYDNPMPGWWVWIFVATVVFAAVYYVGITFFDFVDTYEDDLAEAQAELSVMREAYAEAAPAFEADAATLQRFVADPAMAAEGAATYKTVCAACHGNEGQGLIGPNLTDAYWLHGGSAVEVFTVISKGVPDKGMPPWEASLSPEQRAQLVAFIHSLQGTTPPNPKEPQGELVQ